MSDVRFSIVVPTYNEEDSIERTLDRLYRASPYPADSLEVLVVDESTDRTPAIVRDLDHPNLRVLRFEEPKGLANSVIEGFEASRGEYVGVIDADGQHPPAKLFELFEAATDGALELVVASRYVDGGGIENWTRYRKLVSRVATRLARELLLWDVDVEDPLSGFFVVRGAHLDGVALRPIGYKILLEILVKAPPESFAEVPYLFRDREHGESGLDVAEYLRYLAHLLALARHRYA